LLNSKIQKHPNLKNLISATDQIKKSVNILKKERKNRKKKKKK